MCPVSDIYYHDVFGGAEQRDAGFYRGCRRQRNEGWISATSTFNYQDTTITFLVLL